MKKGHCAAPCYMRWKKQELMEAPNAWLLRKRIEEIDEEETTTSSQINSSTAPARCSAAAARDLA
jgi:hypothetical protein